MPRLSGGFTLSIHRGELSTLKTWLTARDKVRVEVRGRRAARDSTWYIYPLPNSQWAFASTPLGEKTLSIIALTGQVIEHKSFPPLALVKASNPDPYDLVPTWDHEPM